MSWLRLAHEHGSFHEGELCQALRRANPTLNLCPAPEMMGAGALFFARADRELYDQIRHYHRSGKRILAVGVSPTSTPSETVWSLLEAGASDVLAWGSPNSASEVAARLERWDAVDEILESPLVRNNLIGKSQAWRTALRHCVELGRFSNAPVLITGETGTGKELAARLIHALDTRPGKQDLVVLDCTTIMPELSGSEFFGHERGSFTGAAGARDGAFALANNGTLFLDEVGELPASMQAQLLRVIQEHTYKRVGGNEWKTTNFRLVAATNRDVMAEVKAGRFRSDLYYRLAGACCRLPSLRERMDDALALSEHFMAQFSSQSCAPCMSPEVREYILRRDYPGNVRDLRQVISRLMSRHLGPGPVTVGAIPEEERLSAHVPPGGWLDEDFECAIRRALAMGASLKEIGCAAEDTAVKIAVHSEDGNLQRAAQRLGVTDRALQMRRAAQRDKAAVNGAAL
jgi:transcriptional regulator with GAF, ATPase, and Fis domain